jgi:hypothetical protein
LRPFKDAKIDHSHASNMHESHASRKGTAHLPSTPQGKSAFEVQREPKNCCGSSVSQSLAALFGCGSFVAGYVDRYCAVLCASRGGDGDGGAKDLEAEAGKLDSVETRWEIEWAWRLERNP